MKGRQRLMGFQYLSWSGRDDLVKGGMFLVS